MCGVCDAAKQASDDGKSFLDALMSGEISGLDALHEGAALNAEADREALYQAKNDQNVLLITREGHRVDEIPSETAAAQTLAGSLMYDMSPQRVAYGLALMAVRAARAETAAQQDAEAERVLAEAGDQSSAPVSAVDLADADRIDGKY